MKTIELQGKIYAQVKDRLNQFRTDNPNALIETTPTIQEDGQILFKARVLKDKADPSSAEATGHSLGSNKGAKAFEKLETIAVGRALGLLGYAADGEIASSEEMEEFQEYQKEKKLEMILEATEKITDAKNLEELKEVWASIPIEAKEELTNLKEEMKKRFLEVPEPKKKCTK
jgi:hypothetical protein